MRYYLPVPQIDIDATLCANAAVAILFSFAIYSMQSLYRTIKFRYEMEKSIISTSGPIDQARVCSEGLETINSMRFVLPSHKSRTVEYVHKRINSLEEQMES